MPKNQKQSKKSSSKIVIIVLVFLLAMGAIFGIFLLFRQGNPDTVGGESASVEDDYSLTDDEFDPKEQHGGSDVPETPVAEPGEKARVYVMVTNYKYEGGLLKVSGMVNDTTDTSGTCTFYFTSPNGDSTPVQAVPTATPTAVACVAQLDIRGLRGAWKISLGYESETMSGVSTEDVYEI